MSMPCPAAHLETTTTTTVPTTPTTAIALRAAPDGSETSKTTGATIRAGKPLLPWMS